MKITINLIRDCIYFCDVYCYDCLQIFYQDAELRMLYVGKNFEKYNMNNIYRNFANRMKLKTY